MITIRRARVTDAEAIRQLETAVWDEEVTNMYDSPMFATFCHVFVAEDVGKIVGAIVAWPTRSNEVFVSDWVIAATHRGQKIGERLYRRLFRDVDGKAIVSYIDPENIASLAGHKKLGFRIVRTVKNAYGLGEDDDRILVRRPADA